MMVLLTVRTIILRRSRAIEKPLHLRPRRILRAQRDSSRLIHTIMRGERGRLRSAVRPVEQLDRVHDRDRRSRRAICVMQPMLPVGDHVGAGRARCSRPCGRAAARRSPAAGCCRCRPSRSTDAPPATSLHREAGLGQQLLGLPRRFSGRAAASRRTDRRPSGRRRAPAAPRSSAARYSEMSLRQRRDARGLRRIGRIVAQHVAVVLDRCAAARRSDEDCVEPARRRSRASRRRCWRAPARAPAARGPCDAPASRSSPRPREHDLDAVAGEQPDRRLVDRGREHRIGAAVQQRDAAACARPAPGNTACRAVRQRRRTAAARRRQAAASRRAACSAERRPSSGAQAAAPSQPSASATPEPAADTAAPRRAARAAARSGQRPRVGLLDMRARMIDQMHVVHARRAGGHAGEARQAAVDVLDHLAGRGPVVLQHVLDQVDAPARAESSSSPSST